MKIPANRILDTSKKQPRRTHSTPGRVSKKPQTVKTQAGDLGVSVFCGSFLKRKFHIFFDKKLASQGVLTSCANRRTNVPLYAYAFGLLGFGAPLTSDSLSKNTFSTDCSPLRNTEGGLIHRCCVHSLTSHLMGSLYRRSPKESIFIPVQTKIRQSAQLKFGGRLWW